MTTDEEFREQIVSLTGYPPGSRTVQAFMEVVSAAEARGRAGLVAKVKALAGALEDAATDAFASWDTLAAREDAADRLRALVAEVTR